LLAATIFNFIAMLNLKPKRKHDSPMQPPAIRSESTLNEQEQSLSQYVVTGNALRNAVKEQPLPTFNGTSDAATVHQQRISQFKKNTPTTPINTMSEILVYHTTHFDCDSTHFVHNIALHANNDNRSFRLLPRTNSGTT
jgi:hypothetical protein